MRSISKSLTNYGVYLFIYLVILGCMSNFSSGSGFTDTRAPNSHVLAHDELIIIELMTKLGNTLHMIMIYQYTEYAKLTLAHGLRI